MGCGDEKLSKYLTQTFTAHCNAMICQQVTLLGDAEWPKVADAVIEAAIPFKYNRRSLLIRRVSNAMTVGAIAIVVGVFVAGMAIEIGRAHV